MLYKSVNISGVKLQVDKKNQWFLTKQNKPVIYWNIKINLYFFPYFTLWIYSIKANKVRSFSLKFKVSLSYQTCPSGNKLRCLNNYPYAFLKF